MQRVRNILYASISHLFPTFIGFIHICLFGAITFHNSSGFGGGFAPLLEFKNKKKIIISILCVFALISSALTMFYEPKSMLELCVCAATISHMWCSSRHLHWLNVYYPTTLYLGKRSLQKQLTHFGVRFVSFFFFRFWELLKFKTWIAPHTSDERKQRKLF